MTLANAPNYPQWTSIGAQAVLYGAVTPRPDGRNDFGFRLYDPYRQCQLVAYQFTATPEQWRRIGHKIADLVYQRMTGETGLFDSRVVFVAESGTQLNRLSRLAISDQDGFNPVYLTQGDEVIMSPRFSLNDPNEITYVALGRDYSRIYLFNLSTGPALLERWIEDGVFDHPGRQYRRLRDGPVEPPAAPPDQRSRYRHLAVLQPG
jgi:TolB protein